MNWSDKKVLVLDGASRQILPMIKGLHDLGCYIVTVNESRLDNGYTSRYPNKKLIWKSGEVSLIDFLKEEVARNQYDVLFPLSDFTMDLVTSNYEFLSKHVRLPIPPRTVFMRVYDKQQTMNICMDNDIPCPITKRECESMDVFVEKVGFPLIAKPRSACGSQGLKIIRDRQQLDNFWQTVSPKEYLLQQFIPQNDRQLNVHLFRDDNGQTVVNLTTEKCRWYPVDGGASCLCRTIEDLELQKICKKLLDAVDWRSYCDVDLIIDPRDGLPKVIEINGRTSANIKICDLVGINIAKYLMQLAYEIPVEEMCIMCNDVRLRCILTDVLWFLKSPNRFKSKPSWFSVVRTHDQLFSITDPLPLFCYALQKIPGYKAEMKKRERT